MNRFNPPKGMKADSYQLSASYYTTTDARRTYEEKLLNSLGTFLRSVDLDEAYCVSIYISNGADLFAFTDVNNGMERLGLCLFQKRFHV